MRKLLTLNVTAQVITIAQMERITQNTAATAEETAAAREELSPQAESSMGVVNRLARLVESEAATAAVTSRARHGRVNLRRAARGPVRARR